MLGNLHVSHLTGSAKVLENHWFSDRKEERPRYTVEQMFFQPYESKEEFIFCARHVISPLLLIGATVLAPELMLDCVAAYVVCTLSTLLMDGLGFSAKLAFAWADSSATMLCQAIIDLVLLPLTTVALVTRSISTGLKATGVYDYSAQSEESLGQKGEESGLRMVNQ